MPLRIGFLVFPKITQLDMTGPHEVFARMPDREIHLVWKSLEPVTEAGGMRLLPTTTYAGCPQLDLICVPGGPGMNPLLNDEETLAFVRRQAEGARYITAVCTGALVLGAAGLLKGKRATTHWTALPMLAAFGATPVDARTVTDGNVITGGGVTAGIDFALRIAADLLGEDAAKTIQLSIEYNPQPPFNAGSPAGAGEAIVARQRAAAAQGQAVREAAVREAAERLATDG
jgi:cyclohexyl-isocyanide hydratase